MRRSAAEPGVHLASITDCACAGFCQVGLRTICDLRRVAGVCRIAVLSETGFQLCDAVVGGAVADLIFTEEDVFAVFLDGDGGDFVVEPATLLGVLGPSV